MADFQQNFLSSLAGGLQIGQQIKQQRDTSQINRLAGLAYGADPGQREQIQGQMVAINPQMAQQQEQANVYSDERRNKTMVNMARMLAGAPEQARAGIYAQMVPTLSRFGMSELPQEYNAQTAPIIDKAAQSIMQALQGAGGNNVQSTYINAQGKRVAIMRDGSQQELGDANQSIRVLEQEGALPYGVVTSGGVAGQVVPLGGGQQQPMQQQAQPQGAYIDPSLPQEVQAQIRQSLAAGQEPPGQMVFAGGSGASGPVRTPTTGEKAAATERAKQEVQLQYLPAELNARTDAAIRQARGTEMAKTEAEREAQAPKRIKQYEQAIGSAGSVMTSLDNAIKLIGPTTTGWGGARLRKVEGTDAYNLASEIETIKANLGFDRLQQMRDNSPTGGALGAIAVQELVALQSTIANLDPNQSAEQIKQNLERVKEHYEGWVSTVQQAMVDERRGLQAQPQAAAGQRTIVRTGNSNGRKVIQYSDGSVEYGN